MPLPLGFVPPCLPTKAQQPPTGDAWLHKIKHDGFRVVARKDSGRVRLCSRPGNDLTNRFPLIVESLARLRSRSCRGRRRAQACKMGLEGIVSEAQDLALPQRPIVRLDQEQEPGREAMRREAEEDWGR